MRCFAKRNLSQATAAYTGTAGLASFSSNMPLPCPVGCALYSCLRVPPLFCATRALRIRPSSAAMPCAYQASLVFAAAAPRAVPTVPALQRLEGVGNARDFAEACSRIAPGKMFRSANPIGATRTDVAILREQLGICELVRVAQAAAIPTCPLQCMLSDVITASVLKT